MFYNNCLNLKKMKKILTILFICASVTAYSQNSDVNIKFKANEEAQISLGKKWDFTYSPKINPLNVIFNGDSLKIYYDSGKSYFNTHVISYERKEITDYGDNLEEVLYILKTNDDDMIKYIIIEKSYSYGDISSILIKIPYYVKGEVFMYHYLMENY